MQFHQLLFIASVAFAPSTHPHTPRSTHPHFPIPDVLPKVDHNGVAYDLHPQPEPLRRQVEQGHTLTPHTHGHGHRFVEDEDDQEFEDLEDQDFEDEDQDEDDE